VRGTIVTTAKGSVRPFTGAEYLESVRDGREIYIYGERVTDVTTHRAFLNTVRMIARLYDALHDSARRGVITIPTDTAIVNGRSESAQRSMRLH
jgi:aromatic ring hydroxylase